MVVEASFMAIGSASNSLEKYKTAVVLRDGSTLHLRPIGRDAERVEFHHMQRP